MGNKFSGCFRIVIIIISVFLLMLTPVRWFGFFLPLPIGASMWAQRAESNGHGRLFNSVEQLIDASDLVVKAKLVNEETLVLGFGDSERVYDQFIKQSFLVLEVYKGNVSNGEVINILQFKALHGSSILRWLLFSNIHSFDWPSAEPYGYSIDFIKNNFQDDEIIILFLNPVFSSNSVFDRLGPTVEYRNFLFFPLLSPTPTYASLSGIEQLDLLRNMYVLTNPVQAVYRLDQDNNGALKWNYLQQR